MATQVNLTLTFSEVYFLSKDAWFTFIGNVKHHLIKHYFQSIQSQLYFRDICALGKPERDL